MHRTRSVWFLGLAGASALLLAACGGGGGGGGGSGDPDDEDGDTSSAGTYETESVSYETEEDSNPSVSFFTSDDDGLGIRANGVDSGDGNVTKPEVKNVTIEEGDTSGDSASGAVVTRAEIESTCTEVETGEAGGSGDSFDIGVSLDTTGSMGGAAGVLANEVAAFATTLEDEGLDVRFTGITLGDAYATKHGDDAETDSLFDDSVSTGSLGAPPGFDGDERPDTGTDLLSADDMEEFFSKVSEAVGSGAGGGDGAENYLGPVDFLHEQVEWRTDAGRFIIGIGDAVAQTPTTFDSFSTTDGYETWEPPVPDELAEKLSSEGIAFHWVGEEPFSVGDHYDMAELAAATGGVFTEGAGSCSSEESCEVDLTELPAVAAVTSARTTTSCTVEIPSDIDRVTTRFDLEAGERSWRVTAVHSVDR